jgi:hypothetical protein
MAIDYRNALERDADELSEGRNVHAWQSWLVDRVLERFPVLLEGFLDLDFLDAAAPSDLEFRLAVLQVIERVKKES